MRLKLHRRARGEYSGFATRIALSYSVFLLLCLGLTLVLYLSSVRSAQDSFWQQRAAMLENDITEMDDRLSILESYARQLSNDSTFIRLAHADRERDPRFYFTASTLMTTLDKRYFSLNSLPVEWCYAYLHGSEYVLSSSEFGSADLFYRRYRIFTPGGYESWREELLRAGAEAHTFSLTPYTGEAESYCTAWNLGSLTHRDTRATLCVEWKADQLHAALLPSDVSAARLSVTAADGAPVMRLSQGEAPADPVTLEAVSGHTGWRYRLEVPRDICREAIATYQGLFLTVFLLATALGVVLITLLVRRSLRPLRQLAESLSEARAGQELLETSLERQRPMLNLAYTRRLLAGHISSQQEFDHMLAFLHLQGATRFCVLFAILYQYEEANRAPEDVQDTVNQAIERHLRTDCPVYAYAMSERVFVILTAYASPPADPLMDLQHRFLTLHDELMAKHGLWLLAGVGMPSERIGSVWESYEQARSASRYTARNHIFLPYEMIRKSSNTVYYPAEISVKLLHFITSGNRPQVVEMFDLIRRENIEERSLDSNLFDFLLSDLRNTLLKARFHPQAPTEAQQARLAALDERFREPLTFGSLEDIALSLCDVFAAPAPTDELIPAVEQYIRENYQDPALCLNLLSDRFHISESYLSHLFKEKTGINFSVYLESLRLDEAARRLKSDSSPINEVYLDVGYTNATTFRRAFKKKYGFPPSELRGANAAN